MRILAIRGKNLASLAGEFAIDLERPPLDRSGLFAIAGPTGAGKSTLLDALCLALYDEMPRLPKGQGVAVGRADEDETLRVRSNDVRAILRRGSSEGYAEVDFVGGGGRRYRARWELRRARGKVDGRLQNQTLSLRDLETGQALGHNKTEVLGLIAERLGLTFDQFRRSALLAQGEFAAFLKADAKQRSELLERITGTEIYSQLSMAAHRRANDEKAKLTELERQLGHLQPLAAEVRSALERQQTEQRQVLSRAEAARQAAERTIHWHLGLEQLRAAEWEAQAELQQADQAWQAVESRRQQLAAVRQVQPLRGLLQTYDHAWDEQQRAQQALDGARVEEAAAQGAVEHSEGAWLDADRMLQSIITQREAARPMLHQAHTLDAQITDVGERLGRAQQEHSEAARQAERAEQHLGRCQAERVRLAAQRDETAAWLEANAHLADLAGQWGRWDGELKRYIRAMDEAQMTGKALHKLSHKAGQLMRDLAEARSRYAAAQTAAKDVQAWLKTLEDEAARYSLDELSGERARLEQRRERLQELHRQATAAAQLNQELSQLQVSLQACHAQAAQARQAADAKAEALELKRNALAEADRALQMAIIARKEDVASLRGQLRDGEHCPVCGATEHPWAHDTSPLDRLLADQQQRVDRLRGQVNDIAAEGARLESNRNHACEQGEAFAQRIERLQADLDKLHSAWTQRPTSEPLPDNPLAENLPKILTDRLQGLKETLIEWGNTEQLARKCYKQLGVARAALDQRCAERERWQQRVIDLQQAVHKIVVDRDTREAEWQRAEATQREVAGLLAAPLAGLADWRNALDADSALFREHCQTVTMTFQRHQQRRDDLDKSLQELNPDLVVAEATAHHAREEAVRTAEVLQMQRQALEGLQRQRGDLFDGRSTATVEQELNQIEKQARGQADAARQGLDEANTKRAAARQGVRHWQAELQRRATIFEQAHRRLGQALDEQALDLAGLRERLRFDSAWLEAEQAALEAVEQRRGRARTLLEERCRQRQAYQSDQPPRHDAEEAQAELQRAKAEHEIAQQALTEITIQLRQDDDERTQVRGLQIDLDRQRQCWELWEGLRGLIGSADGSKFRTFAQSLTLNMLIDHANCHLQDLARRYRLQRVPGSDLELQVIDQEMGDEVRSVHSLSGGESFLVSLALALGLASLASHRTQVESLFIDEGFGSLDANTLDVAIASLDALQSLGRQVGVISHVPILVERIGVQVRVETCGGGRSVIRIIDNGSLWDRLEVQ